MPGFLDQIFNPIFGEGGPPKSNIPDADRDNFNLPGAGHRGNVLNQMAARYDTREAPQASNESAFRDDQMSLASRLRGQMNGDESMSRLQLRDATDANNASQRSLAASATPGNQAMMQRMAAQNIGRQNQGFGAQAAQLGIQERNAAASALGQLAGQGRGQDMQGQQFNVGAQLTQSGMNDSAAGNARGQELQNAGMQQQGGIAYEQNQTGRRGQDLGQAATPSSTDRAVGIAGAVAPFVMSDERAKTGITDPSGSVLDRLARSLHPHEFSYREPERDGEGRRLGVMAQDVERGGGQGMVEDRGGAKMLDVPKSLSAALALIGRMGERLDAVEGKGGERAMATGGVVTRPTRALVGEAGPEAVIPLDKLPGLMDRLRGVGGRTKQSADVESHNPVDQRDLRREELSRVKPWKAEHDRSESAEVPFVNRARAEGEEATAAEAKRKAKAYRGDRSANWLDK